jgi:general secretion pathway protein E
VSDLQKQHEALIDHLTRQGLAEPAILSRAQAIATQENAPLDRILLRLGLIEEENLIPAVCAVLGISALLPETLDQVDARAAQTLTAPYMMSKVIAPLAGDEPVIRVAMADPGNAELLGEIAFHLDRPVMPVGASTTTIRALLANLTPTTEANGHALSAQTQRDVETLRRSEIDGPVIKFVQEKLTDAVIAGASDVHVESTEDGIALRYRINGVLVQQRTEPSLNPASVIARLKVMAQVNVAERRLPQDGRIDAMIAGRKIDFRFSSLPTHWGESIVCRILDPKALRLGWDRLGFEAGLVQRLKAILERPSGLFLVTGPTGSGKTTTLYTAIAHLNTVGRKIVTVEDPVEYNLPGIQQVQIHEEIGLSFARVLRSVLRHDPNVIFIGEIRDHETAEIAVRAAQVGRLVLSTLHTNAANRAVPRLVDLGVPEFLLRDVLRGVLGQELEIVLCRSCGGPGCAVCRQTGVAERRLRAELI